MVVAVLMKKGQKVFTTTPFGENRTAAETYAKRMRKAAPNYTFAVVTLTTTITTTTTTTITSTAAINLINTVTTAPLTARQRTTSIKQDKDLKRRQRRWQLKAGVQRLFGHELSSSFVSELEYDEDTGKVFVMLSNTPYTYFNVPAAIFTAWTKGAATCQTTDKRKRWWIGKTPSLGAFFNHYIKNKYQWVGGRIE